MNTPQPTTTTKLTAGAADRLYRSLLTESPAMQDPQSSYWQAHFQAVAKRMVELMGIDRYRAWFDLRFPPDTLPTWKAKFTLANTVLRNILEQLPEHREARIALEMTPYPGD